MCTSINCCISRHSLFLLKKHLIDLSILDLYFSNYNKCKSQFCIINVLLCSFSLFNFRSSIQFLIYLSSTLLRNLWRATWRNVGGIDMLAAIGGWELASATDAGCYYLTSLVRVLALAVCYQLGHRWIVGVVHHRCCGAGTGNHLMATYLLMLFLLL